VEALFHSKPIFTSNLDFATVVCGKAAYYFNPMKHIDILDKIEFAFTNNSVLQENIEAGKMRLTELLTWEQAFEEYQRLIEKCLRTN
jgi:glycosyltransferase involved in cell wall biosynthesis